MNIGGYSPKPSNSNKEPIPPTSGSNVEYNRNEQDDENHSLLTIKVIENEKNNIKNSGLLKYCTHENDNFKLDPDFEKVFSFPCCVCVNRLKEITCNECSKCGHVFKEGL